jgi:hypothetical protein
MALARSSLSDALNPVELTLEPELGAHRTNILVIGPQQDSN